MRTLRCPLILSFVIFLSLLINGGTQAFASPPNTLLWRIGEPDDSLADFGDYAVAGSAAAYAIPSDWNTRADWHLFPKGMKGDVNSHLTLTYQLSIIPRYGALLSFKTLDAYKSIPEMAVYSNGVMMGMIQIGGLGGVSTSYPFKETYKLYLPKEFLQVGTNTLRLEVSRPRFCGPGIDSFLLWNWDYLQLESLAAPASEPIHGRFIHLGSTLLEGDFGMTRNAIRHFPVLKWLGIAYSGNVMRALFWQDIPQMWQPDGLAYLQAMRDYNMQVVADHTNSNIPLASDGSLTPAAQVDLTQFFRKYGSFIQYYELENEPGLFHGDKIHEIAIANWMRRNLPVLAPHLKIVAPAWTYWPNTWESDPGNRAQVEAVTDLTNGHSYGQSYPEGFANQMKVFGPLESGWPKEWLTTETGANDEHTDWPEFDSKQPHASIADRILRAHVAMASHFMYHALFFPEDTFALLDFHFDWKTHRAEDCKAFPGVHGEESRLKTFRRLAAAYSTHGSPLTYQYLNRVAIIGKKVYFRAVNTASLAPLPGSRGHSDKILLNFVNFETTPQTLKIRVVLPEKGQYPCERFGPGETYAVSESTIQINALPTVLLTEHLGPGETTQYILTPPHRHRTQGLP